jgi:hypothetical protein
MRYGSILIYLVMSVSSVMSEASCGPPECCAHPHRCGWGAETERFLGPEAHCLQKAASSVDGKIEINPRGYPYSVVDDHRRVAAQVIWSNNICVIRYKSDYHR